jgi:2-polyprenyl-6-methoxyphenol hydroxylase-like FAD-dependent oxidoreductase
MNTTINTQVIIVGAGPTGLSLACQLVRYGIDFVIIEKNSGVTRHSKALGVQARTLEIYEQLGVAKQALKRGQIAGKIRIITNGKVRGGIDLSAMGHGLSPYPYLFVLEQSENERLLYEYLQGHHKQVFWQTELDHFSQDETGVTAHVKTANGGSETIAAQYLVGCDGSKSPVRHQLGLSFEGSTLESMFYVVDAKIDWALNHESGYGCLSRNSFGIFLPMQGKNRYRIIGTFPEGFDKDEAEIQYDEIEQRIKENSKLSFNITNVNWFSVYKVHTRAVNKFSVGRCFVAGDAAHIHSPAGGQGMNTGIQDAYNLAWKLAYVINCYASEKLLHSYNEERLPNAQKLLASTDRGFNVLVGSNWFFGFMRTIILPMVAKYAMGRDFVGKKMFSFMSQIRINYRSSTLAWHAGDKDFKIKAGDRLPYFLIDGESVYDKLHAPKFHLLNFTNGKNEDQNLSYEVENKYGDLVNYQVVPLSPRVIEIFGTTRVFKILIRPDNYIGCISTNFSIIDLTTYLTKSIGKVKNVES